MNHSGHHRLTDSPARGRAVLEQLRAPVYVSTPRLSPPGDSGWRICWNCRHSATSVYVGQIVCIRCHTVTA